MLEHGWPSHTVLDPPQISNPFNEDGLLSDWEAVEGLWDHCFKWVPKCRAVGSPGGVLTLGPVLSTLRCIVILQAVDR